ncbi:hypothetical protein JI75_03680 [Berryella intestinalis]|uniref:Copper-exporting P-type ATPase n=1 Tax=Berryella intestinalis TaxID=1531429 RepID=A0A0A8B9R6_9ACTN|nr:heavy metal translocating P-type ATPase [Berryella intestinalis]AJC11902.1 hypothetical protein JI75_03680 [Berryella intestinalis]
MKRTFDVTGMTCAACSARVEKAARSVAGVRDVSVNLLKNSMEVEFDDGSEDAAAVSAAVGKAGYGARLREPGSGSGVGPGGAPDGSEHPAAQEERAVLRRLLVSVVFTVPLFYLSMGHMLGWPLPAALKADESIGILALAQFILLVPVLAVNFRFFRTGFRSLARRAPNMDSLIALGSGASTVYGVYALFQIQYHLGLGHLDKAVMAGMDLYFESAAMILTLITLGKYFEARAKLRTTDALSSLMELAPKTGERLCADGSTECVPVERICVGDRLVVRSGAAVPVDGAIVEGAGAFDESAITGESVPAEKAAGDPVIGATICASGYVVMRAERVGDDTALAGIVRLVDEATSTKAPIEQFADKVSGVFVPVVIAISLAAFAIWTLVLGAGFQDALVHAITVLVISCPCALGLATPTAVMVGTGRGARNGILVKSAEALQSAHDVKTVVLDKTGTVTSGVPEVVALDAAEGVADSDLVSIAAGLEARSEHPLGRAVCAYAQRNGAEPVPVEGFSQVPARGIIGEIAGERVCGGNLCLMEDEGIEVGALAARARQRADEGATPLFFARAGALVGIVSVADTVKPTSAEAVAELRSMGIRTIMLTGDNERTAAAVQKVAGVDEVVANASPADKEALVARLSGEGKVAMVGDGINDAPALTRADVGIAIGAGTDIAIDSADIVLMRSDLLDVAAAISLSRATLRNVKQNLFWALVYNAVCIPVAAGALAGIGVTLNPMIAAAAMSLSSVSVVSNALRLRRWSPRRASEIVKAPLPSGGEREGKESKMEKTMRIEGMMCMHCVSHVKKALEAVPGVSSVDVDLESGTASIEADEAVSQDVLTAAVTEAGYEVLEVR